MKLLQRAEFFAQIVNRVEPAIDTRRRVHGEKDACPNCKLLVQLRDFRFQFADPHQSIFRPAGCLHANGDRVLTLFDQIVVARRGRLQLCRALSNVRSGVALNLQFVDLRP